ncbi:MAG: DedA family protein [Chloroflexi bacterium]|nr:MAG: DedA family protein [Chloroflexota bacterium]
MWDLVAGALLRAIQQSGELALFLVFLLEEAGVPLPLPGDLALVWAGFRVSTGQAQLFTVLVVVEAATAIGASSLYWLARRGGRPLILRYGRFLHLRESHLQRAEAFVERNATWAVFLGRIVPGCRIVTPLASGVLCIPYRTFMPALLAGTLLNAGAWTIVGITLGPSVVMLLEGPRLTARLLLSAVLLVGLVYLTWQIRRRALPGWRAAANLWPSRRVEPAAQAGLLATLEMTMALGVVLTVFEEIRLDLPERALLETAALVSAGHGTLLGAAFVPVAGLRGPDWLRGLTFALLPTVTSWLVVLPALGAGPLGLGLGAGLVPAAGELVRHLLYGAALGLVYPLLVVARQPVSRASSQLHLATGVA